MDLEVAVRITSAQQIADLLGKDVLIRALVEFIRITPAAKIQPLPGACIFISQLPEIQDFDAIWTLRVTGLEGEELGDITGAIQALIGGSVNGSQVTVVSFASDALIREVEAYKQKQEVQAKLDQVVQTAMAVKDGRDGSQGAQGERGERGERGPMGPMGPAGRDGRDGQDIDVTQTELFDLKDVEQGIAQEKGQVLTWDGSKWTNLFVPQIVSSISGSSGTSGGGGATSIDELTDVDTTTTPPNINQTLVWDGTNWVPGNGGGGATSIDDLTDVDTTTSAPSVDQALVWDGTNWVPGTATGDADGGDFGELPNPDAGDFTNDTSDSVLAYPVDGGDFTSGETDAYGDSFFDGGEIT